MTPFPTRTQHPPRLSPESRGHRSLRSLAAALFLVGHRSLLARWSVAVRSSGRRRGLSPASPLMRTARIHARGSGHPCPSALRANSGGGSKAPAPHGILPSGCGAGPPPPAPAAPRLPFGPASCRRGGSWRHPCRPYLQAGPRLRSACPLLRDRPIKPKSPGRALSLASGLRPAGRVGLLADPAFGRAASPRKEAMHPARPERWRLDRRTHSNNQPLPATPPPPRWHRP